MQRIMLVLVLILLLTSVSLQLSPLNPVHAASLETTFKVSGPIVDTNKQGRTVDGPWGLVYSEHYDMTIKLIPGARAYQIYVGDKVWTKMVVPVDYKGDEYTFAVWGTGYSATVDFPDPQRLEDGKLLRKEEIAQFKEKTRQEYESLMQRTTDPKTRQELGEKLAALLAALDRQLAAELQNMDANYVKAVQAAQEAVIQARERARKDLQPLPTFTRVEAVGIPPVIHLGGTIEVPAQDPSVGREVVLEGCIQSPEGGNMEKEDLEASYGFQLDEAYRRVGGIIYVRKEMVDNKPTYVYTSKPDAQGWFRFTLVTTAQTGVFQIRTMPSLIALVGDKPKPVLTPSTKDTLTVKVIDPKGLKKRLTRYVDPACGGGGAEYETITKPSVTASSPQKQFDYPYGYLDYNVEYSNPSQTATMKGAFLSVRANGQSLYGKRLGDIAPGAKGTVAFRLEHQEKGLRLRVDGKVEPVHLPILGGPAPSLTPGAPYAGAAPHLPTQLSLQARLTASGVDEAASEPLTIEVVDWNKKVAAWAQLQRAAMFGGVSQAKAQEASRDLEEWLKYARRLSQPAESDKHGSGVKLADEYETWLRRLLPLLEKIQKGEFNLLEASETIGELNYLLNEMAVVYRDFCSVLLTMGQEVKAAAEDLEVLIAKVEKEDLPAIWELNKKHMIPASPAYKAALEKYGISPQASYQEYRQVMNKLPDQAIAELHAAMAGVFDKLPPKAQDEYRTALPNLQTAIDRLLKLKAELEKSVKRAREIAELKRFKEAVKEAEEQFKRIREKRGGEDWGVIIQAELFESIFGKDALKEAKAYIAFTTRLIPYWAVYPFVYQDAKKVLPSVEEAAAKGYRLAAELRQVQAAAPVYHEVAKVVEEWADYDTAAGRNLRKLVEHTDKYGALFKGSATDWQQVLANLRTPALSFPPNPTFIPTEVTAQAKADPRLKGLVRELPPVLTGESKTLEQTVEEGKRKQEEQLKKIKEAAESWEKIEKWLTDCASYGLIDINWPVQPGQLQVSVASPVALSVTDDQGRRTGVDPATVQVVLEIPGASYSGKPGEAQTVRILWPSGSYQVNLVGTGEGEYDLTIASGLTGEVVLSHQEQIKKEQSVVADVVMVAKGDAEMGAVALVREVPAEAAEAEEAGPGTAWALWAGAVAGVILLLSGAGVLLWRRAQSSKETGTQV